MSVISSEPLFKDDNGRFRPVTLNTLSGQKNLRISKIQILGIKKNYKINELPQIFFVQSDTNKQTDRQT